MATPKGYILGSVGAATVINIASLIAGASLIGNVNQQPDNVVVRVETASARWMDGQTPTGGMGLPLLAGDGPLRLGITSQVNMLAAGILHVQTYQGFFVL